jgi:hypothetical protein
MPSGLLVVEPNASAFGLDNRQATPSPVEVGVLAAEHAPTFLRAERLDERHDVGPEAAHLPGLRNGDDRVHDAIGVHGHRVDGGVAVDGRDEAVERRRVGEVAGGRRDRDGDAGERRARAEVVVPAQDRPDVAALEHRREPVGVEQLDHLRDGAPRRRDRPVVERRDGAVLGRGREHRGGDLATVSVAERVVGAPLVAGLVSGR